MKEKNIVRLLLCLIAIFIVSMSFVSADSGIIYNSDTGHHYQRVDETVGMSWWTAHDDANRRTYRGCPGYLATVTSAAENSWIINNLGGANLLANKWMGGIQSSNASSKSSGWFWITGEFFSNPLWNGGEPNDRGGTNERHLEWDEGDSGKWNDEGHSIDENTGYIVEFDTSCRQSSVIKFQDNGNFYRLFTLGGPISWEVARDHAAATSFAGCSGHLATINFAAENNFLIQSFGTGTLARKWLGASQPPLVTSPTANWSWVTDEVFSFTGWAAGEPNDGGGLEQYLEWSHTGAGWNDEDNYVDSNVERDNPNNGYVIEYECPLTVNVSNITVDELFGSTVTTAASVSHTGTSRSWTFNDGTTGCDTTTCSYPADDGSKIATVTYRVCDLQECVEDSATITINNVAPTATASSSVIESPRNQIIDFSGTFTDPADSLDAPYTFSWDFGDETSATLQNPGHSYTTIGTYTITFCVTDKDGGVGCDDISVEIINLPPDCDGALPNTDTLWTPNHSMTPITIFITDPDGDPVVLTVTNVSHNEATNGVGDGNTDTDWSGIGGAIASVRAERSGAGSGRIYTIEFSATDNLPDGTCTGDVSIFVPHDMGNGNGDGDGNSNGNSNGNANGNSNGNANDNSNGNANGNSNGNANSNSNSNANGNSNGNSNGQSNGRNDN